MKRWEAIAKLTPHFGDALVVACNGMIGRDLWATGDKPTRFYMIGSMGLASSIGLGLALAQPKRRVIILDGDGNVLMNLGALPMTGVLAPPHFRHVVLDNGVYASTGNQPTISAHVKLEEIARAAGYRAVARVRAGAEIGPTLRHQLAEPGPTLLLIETQPEAGPPAPRIPYTPPEMTARVAAAIVRLAGVSRVGAR